MLIKNSSIIKTKKEGIPYILNLLKSLSIGYIKKVVEDISIPRHFFAEPKNNKLVAKYIDDEFTKYGFETFYQGNYLNLVALSKKNIDKPLVLVGAHYDSVPKTPGADDNASAVAAMLACAKVLAEQNLDISICFVAFNAEEDGLVGSTDFVNNYLPKSTIKIKEAHILEMVGYSRKEKGSQTIPSGLPINIPDIGDFLAIIGNRKSNPIVDRLVEYSKIYLPLFSVIGLKLYFGVEKIFPDLTRSDHHPFWQAKIPATMWTDTSEFRNPNYHQITDTPNTLDYNFLYQVTQLLLLYLVVSEIEKLRL